MALPSWLHFIGRACVSILTLPALVKLELPGLLLACRLKVTGKPIVFLDWAGFRYWQYPGDPVLSNHKRRSVSDASHIVRYVLDNVEPGWICIDVGANIGAVSVPLWSKVGRKGKVISVEADPGNIERIRANLCLNHYPQDHVSNVAIADVKGIVPLRCYPGNNGWQTLGNPAFARAYRSHIVDVPAIRFEELMEIHSLSTVDFVKIDVEGAELQVLSGMRSLLTEKRIGCVVFEVNHLMLEGMGEAVPHLLSFWDDLDYELWRLTEDGALAALEAAWPQDSVGDCVALPVRSRASVRSEVSQAVGNWR